MPPLTANCLNCTRSLTGRADKKFCSDQCRNDFNNKQKYSVNNYIRKINNILRKNRIALEELFAVDPEKDKVSIHKSKLVDHGFRFKYHTHTFTNKNGAIYYYCYEYGILPLDNEWYLLVKQKEE